MGFHTTMPSNIPLSQVSSEASSTQNFMLICNCTNMLHTVQHRRSTVSSETISSVSTASSETRLKPRDNPVTCTLCGKSGSRSSEHQLNQKPTLRSVLLLCYISGPVAQDTASGTVIIITSLHRAARVFPHDLCNLRDLKKKDTAV